MVVYTGSRTRPPEVADALVRAWLELNRPAAALEILQAYQSAYERDGMLDDYYARCLSAYGVVGDHQKAFDASEFLWQRHPTTNSYATCASSTSLGRDSSRLGNVEARRRARIRNTSNSDRHRSVLSKPESRGGIRLGAAGHRSFSSHPQVRASAMHIAFDAGHGDWASMSTTLTRDFPDSGLFEEVKLPTVLDWMRERQAQSAIHGQSFVEGRYPFHLWVDIINGSFGAEFYWRWHFNRDHLPSEQSFSAGFWWPAGEHATFRVAGPDADHGLHSLLDGPPAQALSMLGKCVRRNPRSAILIRDHSS